MPGDDIKLSSSTTVAQYRALEAAMDKRALHKFVVERFDERYFRPVQDSPSKHGFTLMAVACLVIETLESFYEGRADTRRASTQMFRDFFARNTALKVFATVRATVRGSGLALSVFCTIVKPWPVLFGWNIRALFTT